MEIRVIVDIVELTRSKDKTKIYILAHHITSFTWIGRFNSTVINMEGAASIWVDETPQEVWRLLRGTNDA